MRASVSFRRLQKHLLTSFVTALLSAPFYAIVPASAQVIEIDDDGSTRVFSGPTLHVSGEPELTPAKPVGLRADNEDRFERIALSEKVDSKLLRAVAWKESRGRMSAVSSKGALGIMQLMPATASAMGVDPLDPDGNVVGGARYLSQMISRFHSVPLALAAYNAGPGAVAHWGGIPPFAETRSYVSSILSRLRADSAMPMAAVNSLNSVGYMLVEVP